MGDPIYIYTYIYIYIYDSAQTRPQARLFPDSIEISGILSRKAAVPSDQKLLCKASQR